MASHSKKGAKNGSRIGFLDESGISERPSVRRSWAPKGQTPLIRSTGSWKTRSVIGLITCTARGRRPKLYLRIFKHTIHDVEIIHFVKELRRHIRGKLILIWDGLSAHRSKASRAFLKTQKRWLRVERFPPYAPELNPVEYLWSSGKRTTLANYSPDTTTDLDQRIRSTARRCQRQPDRLKGFLKASTLYP